MTFQEIVTQVMDWLQRDQRLSYAALKRQFNLDDAYLEDVKVELIVVREVARERDNTMLVWIGGAATSPPEAPRQAEAETRFYAILPVLIDLLQRQGRLTYRSLTQIFGLNETLLEDLRQELLLRRLAMDEDGAVLVWTGATPPTAIAAVSPLPQQNADEPLPPELARNTPEAERRQLTVMFCDLADSTKLSQQLDPEDLRTVVRTYQTTAAEVIQAYAGHIAQYLGDGLLIYFGWPQAHEDDVQRALHAGLGIVDAITTRVNPRLETAHGIHLTVRIGIHTGPVVVGEMGGGGRHEHLATGETVNIAARLEGLAAPNTVVISHVTAQLARHTFALEDLGVQPLKGVAEPMPVFRVLESLEEHDDEPTAGAVPFLVGRDEEIGLLRRCWERSKAGLGQAVLLSGEAGRGKPCS